MFHRLLLLVVIFLTASPLLADVELFRVAVVDDSGSMSPDGASNAMLFAVANNHGGELYPAAFYAVPILLEIAICDEKQAARATALAILDDMLWFSPGLAPFDTVDVDGIATPIDIAFRQQVAAAMPTLKATSSVHPVSSLIASLAESLTKLEA